MDTGFNEIFGASVQLLFVFVLVIFCWLGHRIICKIRKIEEQKLFHWAGIIKPTAPWKEVAKLIAILIAVHFSINGIEWILGLSGGLNELMETVPVAELAIIEPAPMALCAGIAYAFLRTGGAEELLFRGVFFTRLVHWFGFLPANILQGVIFALLHNAIIYLALPNAPLWIHVDLFVRITILSWLVGWYMIKRDRGSIFLPWICHGCANLFTFLSFFIER